MKISKSKMDQPMGAHTAKSPKKIGPKKLRHLTVSHAENGGHIVEHQFDSIGYGPYVAPEQHVFGKGEGAKMLAHVGQTMGVAEEPDADDAKA